jgi:hypothetical protein
MKYMNIHWLWTLTLLPLVRSENHYSIMLYDMPKYSGGAHQVDLTEKDVREHVCKQTGGIQAKSAKLPENIMCQLFKYAIPLFA